MAYRWIRGEAVPLLPGDVDVVVLVRVTVGQQVGVGLALVERGLSQGIYSGHLQGLNKNTLHSLALTRRLTEIADLGLPLPAAVSNKDFVGEATGLAKPDRTPPPLTAATG